MELKTTESRLKALEQKSEDQEQRLQTLEAARVAAAKKSKSKTSK